MVHSAFSTDFATLQSCASFSITSDNVHPCRVGGHCGACMVSKPFCSEDRILRLHATNTQCVTSSGPPPGIAAASRIKKDTQSTFTGQSTVVKMPRACEDKTVTAMVPASVRVKREMAANAAVQRPRSHTGTSALSGFGLMPTNIITHAAPAIPKPAVPSETDTKYQDFLAEMNALGAMAS